MRIINHYIRRNMEAAPHDTENPPYMQLETSMRQKLGRLSPMSPLRCIFRVPNRLRCVREKAYTPQVISIGPLHYGKQALKAMEEHKMRYLECFINRQGETNSSLMDYIRKIKGQEEKLRNFYSETIELSSDEFVRIILVDAIFIIEFLFRSWYKEVRHEDDCIIGKPWMSEDVWLDLLMLENQLPFFILEDLFDPDKFSFPIAKLNGARRLSILFLSHYFLLNSGTTFLGRLDNLETINSSEVQHFVDLLSKLCTTSIPKKEYVGQYIPTTAPSIAKLHLAGVKFKVRSTNNLFDIEFKCSNGILEIPKLKTEDTTELILRNLLAFERCTFKEHYMSDYVGIMDMFVDTPKDVELLVEYRIVENYLGGGDNELCTMINSLSTGIIYDSKNFYYGTLCEELNKFCSSKWNKSMANLRDNYFNTPWAIISFVAAVVLLILTVIQTICSIISLKN